MTKTKKKTKKKSTKKTKKTKKNSVKRATKSSKQPKWGQTSFKKIETARADLGLTKVAMAELLGVTNSTYHNWRKGEAVPHVAAQAAITKAISKARAASSLRGGTKKKRATKKSKARGRKRQPAMAAAGAGGNGSGHSDVFLGDRNPGAAGSGSNGSRLPADPGTFQPAERVTGGGPTCDESLIAEPSQTRVIGRKVPPEVSTLALLGIYLNNPSTKVSAGSLPKLVRDTRKAFSG